MNLTRSVRISCGECWHNLIYTVKYYLFFLLVVTDACSFFCEIIQDIPGYGKFQKRKLLNEDSIIHCPGDMTNDE